MRLSATVRRVAAGFGLALLGTVSGFAAGLLRRHRPSSYVADQRAPEAGGEARERGR